MSDETTSVWADIWAKTKGVFAWGEAAVAQYPNIALILLVVVPIAVWWFL